MAWQGLDPRLEGHMTSWSGGLNRWLLKYPFRGPVIGFIIAGIFTGLSFISGMGRLIALAIFLFVLSTSLLIYALIRRASGTTFVEDEDVEEEPPPEEYTEVDEQARQQALDRWRQRARQGRQQ